MALNTDVLKEFYNREKFMQEPAHFDLSKYPDDDSTNDE